MPEWEDNRSLTALTAFKPDAAEAAIRWQAFYAGEIVDRPVVCVTAPLTAHTLPDPIAYYDKVFENPDEIINRGLAIAEATFWGGEAFPSFYPSIGPDEIAVFTGAELRWSQDSPDTNWSVPYVDDWEKAFPLLLHEDHPLFQHQLNLYRKAADRFAGRILLVAPDLHTNMDLLSAIRGPQRLCLDLLDRPELIDQAMLDVRSIFRQLWDAINQAGRMNETGYCLESHGLFSIEGSATLQCDVSIMLSPAMFRRWILPALEEEAEIVKHVVYHWDGPGALVHMPDLLSSKGLRTLSFVPGAGHGDLANYINILQSIQAGGKAVHVWGSPDQCRWMHRQLRPESVFYCTETETQDEAEGLLDWFSKHT